LSPGVEHVSMSIGLNASTGVSSKQSILTLTFRPTNPNSNAQTNVTIDPQLTKLYSNNDLANPNDNHLANTSSSIIYLNTPQLSPTPTTSPAANSAPPTTEISGIVYVDRNNNGIFDKDELTVPN